MDLVDEHVSTGLWFGWYEMSTFVGLHYFEYKNLVTILCNNWVSDMGILMMVVKWRGIQCGKDTVVKIKYCLMFKCSHNGILVIH